MQPENRRLGTLGNPFIKDALERVLVRGRDQKGFPTLPKNPATTIRKPEGVFDPEAWA